MGNLLLPSIRTITSSIDSSSGHLLHFRCAITNGTVQRFVMNQILMKLDFNQVQQMCDWNDNFFQGCGCPSSCDKIRRCRRGDCQTTTTDPRQNVTVVWLPGKCDRHKYLTPSSSEGSFPQLSQLAAKLEPLLPMIGRLWLQSGSKQPLTRICTRVPLLCIQCANNQ